MAIGGGDKIGDFYAVLGLKKECSDSELRNAYKKLAMRWHPDRCSAHVNSKFVEEAKEKFQEIQEAYSVLSDSNKRFLYDIGAYDSDDDENLGMGDFLGEMAQMMSQNEQNGGGHESFEELQQLFVDLFQSDLDGGFGGPASACGRTNGHDRSSASPASSSSSCSGNIGGSNKRDNSAMDSVTAGASVLDSASGAFCFGSSSMGGGGGRKRRHGQKQKAAPKHGVSSRDAEISAA